MKKNLIFLMGLLLMTFLSPPRAQAEDVTICSGSTTNKFVPIGGFYLDMSVVYNQFIYPESTLDLSEGDQITAITFYTNESFGLSTSFTLYMGETEAEIINASDVTANKDLMTDVYTGKLSSQSSNGGGYEITITLTNPYDYKGKNLLVGLYKNSGSDYTSYNFACYGISAPAGSSYHYCGSSYNGQDAFLPKATISYEPGEVKQYDAKVSPSSIEFGRLNVNDEKVIDVTLKNNGVNPFTPTVNISGDGFSTTYVAEEIASKQTVTIPVKFAPTAVGDFTGTLTIDCGHEITPFEIPLTGNAVMELTVAEGNAESRYVPVYGYYFEKAQHNQMIYPASILTGLAGKSIKSITFHPQSTTNFYGGKIYIRLLETTQAEFSTATYVEVSGDAFGSVVPSKDASELTITLDREFIYVGGNLLIDIQTEAGTYGSSYTFKGISKEGASLYKYGTNSVTKTPYLPTATFGYEDATGVVIVNPSSLTFGGDGFYAGQTSEAQTFTVKNTTSDAVTISAPEGDNVFTFTPALPLTVDAGTNATVSVVYNPAAGGEHTATISVGEKTVTLNGKASEVSIDVTPAELTFGGESFIQGNTETKQVTITNNTPNSLTTALAVADDGAAMFTVGENTTIASGQTGTVNVTYNPTAAGTHTATLTVVEGKTVALTGTSIAQVISGTVTPESLSLTCAEGKTATDKITVANTGNMAFTPVFNIQSADADVPFSIVEATEIAAGASKEFTVTYAPDFVGEHTATLTVTINGEETTVALNGTATEGPKEVTVADGSATSSYLPVYGLYYDESTQSNQMIYTSEMLGKRMVGKRITSMTFYSKSAVYFSGGNVTFSLANIPIGTSAFTSAARLEPDGLTQVHSAAAPGETRTEWTLTFPDNVYFIYNGENLLIDVVTEHGTFKSVSFIGENGHNNASWYSYSGAHNTLSDFLPKVMFTFEDAVAQVTVSPEELTFGGDNFVYGNTEAQTFKVTNTTANDVELNLNDENRVYTIEPSTIEAGAINEVVTVTYAPTAAGEHSATVTAGDKTVTLTGKAVAPSIGGNVTPSEVTLEANVDGEGTQTITIENTGNTAFTPAFSGIEAPFSIEEATEIPVGESKSFNVKYNPTEFKTHEGILTVIIGENTTDVTLNGIAYQALDDVTVADGEDEGHIVPFYGYYADGYDVYGQMIYPAADLVSMKGKSITAIKFYSSTGIKFSGATYDVTIGTTSLDAFPDKRRVTIEGGVKASVSPAKDDDVIEIKFSKPFIYVGGNLIVDTYLTERTTFQLADPSDGATKYSGKTQTATTAINSAAGGCSAQFLPKITFSLAESAAGITFAELCENGKKDNVYTITDELTSVYQNGTSVWFKDNNNSIVKDVPAEGDKDFEVEGVSQMDFDQSNWIEVVFADEETAEKFTLQPKKVVGITGTYVDNVNPTLVVSNGVKYSEAKAEAYTPNPYIPANFLGSQDCQSGQNHGHFFFAKPKVQEYATIMYAMYDGNNIMKMYASGPGNGHMFQGQFTIDMSQNETQDVELKEGVVYSNFKAIIRKVSTQNAPSLKAEGEGGYVVYPQDLKVNNALPTAINGVVAGNGVVKSVKYVNVAGIVSDRPFQGVNIVVTEFTDGSSTTTKVVR